LTKNGFVTSFVISPTLIVAAFPDVLADATVAAVAVAPTTSRAIAAIPSRVFTVLAIGIFHPPDPDCGIGAVSCSRSCGWADDRTSQALAQPLAINLAQTGLIDTESGLSERIYPRKRLTQPLAAILLQAMPARAPMITMADVARVAGVSTSTVSHVVNGTRKVSEVTERAVREAIQATGYTHDRIARSLATGRTRTIGLAMSAISNPYFAELAHAIEREAAHAGYSLLLADTHDDPERELRATRDLLGRRVDGVILAPSAQPAAALEILRKRGVPTVLIDRFMPVELDQIATENIAPTARLVEHLAELGHERIGMIAGLQGLATSEERIEGYRRGLASASLAFDPELVVRGDSDAEHARAALADLLDGNTELGFRPAWSTTLWQVEIAKLPK